MSTIPFTPPHVSINRVRIVDLPGLAIDDAVRGRSGYELLSARAVIEYARAEALALDLPPRFAENNRQTRLELPLFVDSCLSSDRTATRFAAEAIGQRLGRNLGHILDHPAPGRCHQSRCSLRLDGDGLGPLGGDQADSAGRGCDVGRAGRTDRATCPVFFA